MPITLTFHDSQYPAPAAAQVHTGLRTRQLPGKLLYDTPAQAQRWLAYHQAYSPSRTQEDLLTLYQQAYQALLTALDTPRLHYVSLGCGGGNKDALFVQQAVTHGADVRFTPTDTSPSLVLETMLRIEGLLPVSACAPLVVDLSVEPDLLPWFARQENEQSRRVLSCFGMLPNFPYRTFLPYLRRHLRPGDSLLLSANLSPQPHAQSAAHIVPQYDNAFSHAWFMGLLESLGFAATRLQLTVTSAPLQDDGHIWQIRAEARLLEAMTLTLDGTPYALQADETLHIFFSNRFTPAVMPQVFAEAGLTVRQSWLVDSHEEGIYWCTATPS